MSRSFDFLHASIDRSFRLEILAFVFLSGAFESCHSSTMVSVGS